MKILHAADLHLDSPMRGLERYEGAPVEQMRAATRQALGNLVDLCLAEEVKLLLIAGDLYDGDWKDYSTGLFLIRQLSRLREGDVQVALIRGNHDARSSITRHLKLPANVTELSTRTAQSVAYEELGVVVHGQGFAKRAVTKDLAARYPDAISGAFNIGLLHTCASGRVGHERYAPTTLQTLTSKGYDYWALGHVHQREVLSEAPWVVFCGNLQGRHAREIGAKGASLIEVVDGRVQAVEHQPLDVVRWARLELDASTCGSGYDVVELVRQKLEEAVELAEGRTLAARVVVYGPSAAHGALRDDEERWRSEIRAAAIDVGDAWIEKVQLRTSAPQRRGELAERDDAVGQVVRALRSLQDDDARVAQLIDALDDLRRKLPGELRDRSVDGGRRLDDPATIRGMLSDVEELLMTRLVDVADDSAEPPP